jgi:endonuclease/exonuclease/phosphatase family metal-dependent hydrolase
VAFNDWRVEVLPCWDEQIEFVLPLRVSRGAAEFTLLAVWAMFKAAVRRYPIGPERGQLRQALDLYSPLLKGPVVIAGDFNSSMKLAGKRNHAVAVDEMTAAGLVSAYHVHKNVAQGAESEYTHNWTWKRDKPFHIDYIWLPETWSRGITVQVGDYDTWVGGRLSDHVPVTAEFSIA